MYSILTRSLWLLPLILALPGAWAEPAAGLRTARPESVGMSSQRLERVEEVMKRYIDADLIAGSVTLVARKGRVVHFEAQGMADVENGRVMTTDTIFRIASMTKPITSVALMMLYEEGLFQLNDPISKWLPEFSEMKVMEETGPAPVGTPYVLVPAKRPISVKHMLTHTAGLMSSYRSGHLAVWQNQPNLEPGFDLAEWTRAIAKLPLAYHPGERWEYSSATSVVGRLVEVLSGMTLDEFFHERIFEPLGMEDTYFYLPESKLGRFAAQYRPYPENGNRIVLQDAPTAESHWVREPHSFFSGAGGLVSTAADYVRFQQMVLNGGELDGVRLLGRKTVELMLTNHTGEMPVWLAGPGSGFGLGYSVVLDRGEAATSRSEGSAGWGGAFNTVFWIDPEEELVGILMTQLRPYNHLNIRADFMSTVNQAIVGD